MKKLLSKIYLRNQYGVALNLKLLAYCRFGSCSYLDIFGFMVYQRVGDRRILCLRKN